MRMVRQKTQIRKIENLAARQVTFSKRRRGLFKKAQELCTLCDVDIALIVFSATGKLFHYSPSSMNQVLEKRRLVQTRNVGELRLPSQEMEIASRKIAIMSNELTQKTTELRQMKGEDIKGLDLNELDKLESMIESGLVNVAKTKGQKMLKEINILKEKEAHLLEENAHLKQRLAMMGLSIEKMGNHDQYGQHPSWELTISNLRSKDPPQDNKTSDTYLKLGLPFSN